MAVAYTDSSQVHLRKFRQASQKTNKKRLPKKPFEAQSLCRLPGLHALAVFASAGVDFDLVALGDKNWHTNLEAGGQLGGLEHFA